MHNDIDRDLYEILGVDRNATQSEIKTAYRSKARECHPDVAHHDPDGERKFKELTFAYEVLCDGEKRRDYDAWGMDGLRRGAGVDAGGFSNLSDLIDAFFGGGFGGGFGGFGQRPAGRARTRGRDVGLAVSITLQEVHDGTEREVEIERLAQCDECGGSGMAPGTHASRCDSCGGTGQHTTQQRSLFGTVIRSSPCIKCGGTGQVVTEPCGGCGGEGRLAVEETIKVTVPAGIERGDRLRVQGKGEAGEHGGPTGDLYVFIDVEPHPDFDRDGHDLLGAVTVDMVDAALGKELTLQSLDGPFKLKVPAGTQPGKVIKVKGKGLPVRGGGRKGDILISVEVAVPTRLSGEEKKLLEQLRDRRGGKAGR